MALDDKTFAKHPTVNLKKPSTTGSGPGPAPAKKKNTIPIIPPAPSYSPPGGGGGGVGSNSTGQVSTKPPAVSINQYLAGDSTYQQQIAAYHKALTDYEAQQNTQRTAYAGTYATNKKNLDQARTQGEGDLTDDYASRGLVTSGLYGKAYADLDSQYNQRQTALDTDQQSFLNGLTDALNNYKTTQQAQQTTAKQQAIARRAAS